ncbi:uncharacterized protein LOC130994699 isoform X2 [Salvia miltiorrhiza]|uniref:uncharacterized protein LOC130994699 isoform X2 n=1 Tax=Salvia miltiorrhiza TaxID=226208 RepID=UPI0025ACB3B3|nr:uncharacterized protein LOC130994699 isoform X2 [Salvia miltiorrhiza]
MAVAASTPSISSRTVIDCRHCRCPLFFSVLDRLEAKEPPPPFATFIPPPTLPADLPLPPPENQKSLYHLPSPTCTTNRIFFASFQLQLQVPSPHIVDPAEKYISLIIPAYNEEHRIPGALDETLK